MEYEKYENLRETVLGRGLVVAIDGPSGSGKSTIARNVAAALDLGYLDTGAMYRAAAWWIDHQGLNADDSSTVERSVATMDLRVNAVPHAPRFFVEGIDVAHAIRTDHINEIVSAVSALPGVRKTLIEKQREIIKTARESTRGIVVEGRDITSVVAPEAEVRILLTADPETRLQRRAIADQGSAEGEALNHERALVIDRDAKDAKVTDFLEAGPGVTTIDSTNANVSETLDAVMKLIDKTIN